MEIDNLLKQVKRIHFIGIGGSGMCPLAEILMSNGYILTGSDNNTGDNIDKLKSLGAKIVMGQSASNIKEMNPEMIVYTAALLPDNPELVAAKASRIPTFERAALFGAITRMFDNCICICGTHGKTTSSSMLSQILLESNADPTLMIGGRLPAIDSHGRAGKSEIMVAEACEFKNTYHSLSPDTAVLLNIDDDHLEFFKTIDNLRASFAKFVNMATHAVIYNGDDENTVLAIDTLEKREDVKFISFGLSNSNDYYAENITYNRGAFPEFDVFSGGEMIGHVKLNIPGKHNVFNALGVIAAAIENGITMEQIEASIHHFGGAGRRFEVLGHPKNITVADDYAHHPTELRAILESVMKMDYKEVWAVFQPFTYSRTYMLMDDFAEVLRIPDHCVLTEIMGSRERNTYGVYSSQLSEKIPGSVWFETFGEVTDYVVNNAKPGDLVITLGCGDIYKAAKMIIKKIEED